VRIVGRGVVNSGEAGGPRAVATFPSITRLSDGDLLAAYRVGSTKDSDDETSRFVVLATREEVGVMPFNRSRPL
jgi:hypothetical protein